MNISGVIVTRGDVDLKPILASMKDLDEVVVWNNAERVDRKVYGRFEAMKEARNEVVYCQDDDVITHPERIVSFYSPGVVTANVPVDRRDFYSDGITLIGWGSVFDRSLTRVFRKYLQRWPEDDLFLRECDRIFTGLNTIRTIDIPFEHLPHAHGLDRMGAERRHLVDLAQIRTRISCLLKG